MALAERRSFAFEPGQPAAQDRRNGVRAVDVLPKIDVFRGHRSGQGFDVIEAAARENFLPVLRVGAAQGKFLIQPQLPMVVEEPVERRAVVFVKLRVDAGFERVKPQQIGGEAVDRADIAALHVSERVMDAAVQFVFRELVERDQRFHLAPGFRLGIAGGLAVEPDVEESLQALAQPELHFIGGFVGEGEGDDLGDLQRLGIAQQQMHQAIDEQGRLAGAGAGGDDQIAIEGGDRGLAIAGVAKFNRSRARAHRLQDLLRAERDGVRSRDRSRRATGWAGDSCGRSAPRRSGRSIPLG